MGVPGKNKCSDFDPKSTCIYFCQDGPSGKNKQQVGICVKLLLTIHENVQSSKEANKSSLINVFKVCLRISSCCVVCTRI